MSNLRVVRSTLCLLLGLTCTLAASTAWADVIALKRDAGLTTGGSIDSRFNTAFVVTTTVSDAPLYTSGNGRWMNGGQVAVPGGTYHLYKFDLSVIPAGSTINLAQLRLYHTIGNGTSGNGGVAQVLTHAWSEGPGTVDMSQYPGVAGGVSDAHPFGYNTSINQNANGTTATPWQSWGTTNDAFFSMGMDAGTVVNPSSYPSGDGYHVINVTSHVQDWVSGTKPNYGWAQGKGNWNFHHSEAGSADQPVLFIDYTATAPTVTLSVNKTSMAETGDTAILTATLSRITTQTVTVNLAYSGTATSGTDYTTTGNSIVINPGNLTATATITATDDSTYEGNETVIVDISSVTNGTESGTQQVTVTITEDDQPTIIALKRHTGLTDDSQTDARFNTATVVTTTVNDTFLYYTGTGRYCNFGISNPANYQNVLYKFNLSSIPAGSVINLAQLRLYHTMGNSSSGIAPIGTVLTHDWTEGTKNNAYPGASRGASWAHPNGANTTYDRNSENGTTPPLQSWGATNDQFFSMSGDVSTPLVDPSSYVTGVGYHVYNVTSHVQAWVNGTSPNYGWAHTRGNWDFNMSEAGTTAEPVLFVDFNPAPPTVTLSRNNATFSEAVGTCTLTATLSRTSSQAVTVNLAYSGTATSGTDYTAATSITVNAGQLTGTTNITAINDTIYEGNETVVVDIASVTGGTESGTQQVSATITDNDSQPSVTLIVDDTGIDEDGGQAALTATLSNPSTQTVTVNLSLSGTAVQDTDYTSDESVIIIAGQTSGTLTGVHGITARSDDTYEGDETITVDIGSVTNGTESGTQQVTITIADADPPPSVTLGIDDTSIPETGGTATLTATLSHLSTSNVMVTLDYSAGTAARTSDFNANTSITVSAGSWTGTTAITTIGDSTYEGDETIIVAIDDVTGGTEEAVQEVTATIVDDDRPTIIALKRHTGLTDDSSTDARFNTATVVTTTVNDTALHGSGNSRYLNYGTTTAPDAYWNLYKLNLSSIPAGSTINLAQLRLYRGGGNTTSQDIGQILTHDWTEGTQNGAYPGAAGGASGAHPNGINTSYDQNANGTTATPWQSWGTANYAFFSMAGDVSTSLVAPSPTPVPGAGYHVYNVTSHVQAWVNGTLPNYGWAHDQGNWTFNMSETGTTTEPVLFVDFSAGTADVTAPGQVTSLAASNATQTTMYLTWTAPGDDTTSGTATGYDIRYSLNPIDASNWGSATQVLNEPTPAAYGTNQSMTIQGLTPDREYYFALKASDEVPNTSVLSNVASGFTLPIAGDITAPAAITNLATSAPTSTSIKLTWTAPGDDTSTGTAASYDIRYRTGGAVNDSNWASATPVTGEPLPKAAGSAETFTVPSLSANTTYYFAIKTSDEVPNPSLISNSPSGQTTSSADVTKPGQITNLAVDHTYSAGTNQFLRWTAPGDDGSTGKATRYDLRCSLSTITEGNWASATQYTYNVPLPATAGTSQSANVVYLNMGARYYFAIKTVDEAGNWSDLSNVATDPLTPWTHSDMVNPEQIANLAVSNMTSNSVTLTWTASGDDGMFGTATSYDVRYIAAATGTMTENNWFWNATKATGEPTPQAYGSNETFTVTGLNASTPYYFAIRAVDGEMNWSSLSNIVGPITTLTATDSATPAAISDLVANHPSSGTVRLTWTAPGDDNSSGTATTYDIRYRTGGQVTTSNWSSATQATGELAPKVAGTTQTWTVQGLSANTTYYFAIKALDEVGNPGGLSNSPSCLTLTSSSLNKPVLTQQDFEYLGAFKLPTSISGRSTSFSTAGIALRRVGGNIQIIAQTANKGMNQGIYECTFPGWGSSQSTWPQSTVIRDWGATVYGSPSVFYIVDFAWYTHGLLFDPVTSRFYFSFGYWYNTNGTNQNCLAWSDLNESGPVTHGPWHGNATTAHSQKIRGGSTIIPDWFANTYVGGRKLGVGFGGYYSGVSSCARGPFLAAANHPADGATELSTVNLIDYPPSHFYTRDTDYYFTPVGSDPSNPIDGDGFWTWDDEVWGAGTWIDLPDKHGMVFMPTLGHGHCVYIHGKLFRRRGELHCTVYDPKDLAAVAQGASPWTSQPQEWIVPLAPRPYDEPSSSGSGGIVDGMAFDPQSRILFVVAPAVYKSGTEIFPVVHGWHIKE